MGDGAVQAQALLTRADANGCATEEQEQELQATEAENSLEGSVVINERKGKGGRGRRKSGKEDQQQDSSLLTKNEPVTPLSANRPTREKKSVNRFADSVESVEKDKARGFKIEQGSGCCLKDIPNIVFKLSKRKGSDELLQLLHKLLYGRRMKPHHTKPNILQFSGFVWSSNEEKEKTKVREKLDKCVKESLLQISDLLDLNIPKTTTKKEDVVTRLLEFLECPNKTTDKILQEGLSKEKRKKTPSKGAGKKRQKREKKTSREEQSTVEEERHGDDEEDDDVEVEPEKESVKKKSSRKNDNAEVQKKSSPKHSVKSTQKQPKESKKSSGGEREVKQTKAQSPVKVSKKQASKLEIPVRSPSKGKRKRKVDSSHVLSRKKQKDQVSEDASIEERLEESKNDQTGPKERAKSSSIPSDDKLRPVICDLLKEADFSTVTFADVLKELEKTFGVDFSKEKAHVKILIQEEISKLADGDDSSDQDNGTDEGTGGDHEEHEGTNE